MIFSFVFILKLSYKPQVPRMNQADVVYFIFNHRQTIQAHTKGKTLPFTGVELHIVQNLVQFQE